MAKGKKSSAPSAAADSSGSIRRSKRNSFERKCLSKAMKRMYSGSSPTVFRLVDKMEKDLKRKPKAENKAK